MSRSTRTLAYAGACVALALGGAAISNAASQSSSSSSSSSAQTRQSPPDGHGMPPNGGPPGRHTGADGKQEQALSAADAAKVKAAAEAKIAGGPVERTETDVDTGSPYEAHVRKADGSEVIVYVDKTFDVTSAAAMQHP